MHAWNKNHQFTTWWMLVTSGKDIMLSFYLQNFMGSLYRRKVIRNYMSGVNVMHMHSNSSAFSQLWNSLLYLLALLWILSRLLLLIQMFPALPSSLLVFVVTVFGCCRYCRCHYTNVYLRHVVIGYFIKLRSTNCEWCSMTQRTYQISS
jgi:small-conductance mechanosensitive channel